MEKSTRTGIRAAGICAIIALLPLVGCGNTASVIRTKSETELQVSAIRAEWLKRCEGLSGPMPANEVGALLQDNADMAASLAECMHRHNSLVEHLTPIVKKERETPANP